MNRRNKRTNTQMQVGARTHTPTANPCPCSPTPNAAPSTEVCLQLIRVTQWKNWSWMEAKLQRKETKKRKKQQQLKTASAASVYLLFKSGSRLLVYWQSCPRPSLPSVTSTLVMQTEKTWIAGCIAAHWRLPFGNFSFLRRSLSFVSSRTRAAQKKHQTQLLA